MTYSSETKRTIAGAVAGLLYGLVLAFLSLGAVGAGHGTPIPLYVSSAPLSVFSLLPDASSVREPVFFAMLFAQPLVWLVPGWLVALGGRKAGIAAGLLALHYACGLAVVAMTGVSPRGIAGELPDFFVIWLPVYFVGQAVLWWQISRHLRRTG